MEEGAEAAFDAVASGLLGEPDVDEGTGFGSMPGLRAGGKIFAMLVDGDLVVKLPAERCAGLVEAGEATPFQVGRRQMREWARIGRVDEQGWLVLAREARAFVRGDRAA